MQKRGGSYDHAADFWGLGAVLFVPGSEAKRCHYVYNCLILFIYIYVFYIYIVIVILVVVLTVPYYKYYYCYGCERDASR